MNSTIKQKTGKCIDCPEGSPDKPLIAGRCKSHYWNHRSKVLVGKKVKDAAGWAAGDPSKKLISDFNHLFPTKEQTDKMVSDILDLGVKPAYAPPAPRSRKIPTKTSKKESGTKAWYDYHIQNTDWVCQECGKKFMPLNEKAAYSAQAHILPKKEQYGFPSVKNVLENHLLLGPGAGCGHHNAFDSSWERASRMKVFPLAYKIVTEKLIHLLSPQELSRLPEVFTKPLKINNDEQV